MASTPDTSDSGFVRALARAILAEVQNGQVSLVGALTGTILIGDGQAQQALANEIQRAQAAEQLLQQALTTHAALIASADVLGHVKVDGVTITIDPDGMLHATGGGSEIPPPPDTYAYVTYGGDYVTLNGAYVYLET